MVNIAIVDDSKKDSELLQSFLETFKKETNTNLYYDSYDDGLKFLENYHLKVKKSISLDKRTNKY